MVKGPVFYSNILLILAVALAPWPSMAQLSRDKRGSAVIATDSASADYYYKVAHRYWQQNADSVLFYANLSLKAARRSGYSLGEANALLAEGVGHVLKEDNVRGLDCYLRALRISEKLRLPFLSSNLYNDVGTVYANIGEYNRSNEYFQRAYRMVQAEPSVTGKGVMLTNIADNFKNLGRYDSALYYNYMALPIATTEHDSVLLAAILLNTGEDYSLLGKLTDATACFRHCREIAGRIQDDQDIAWADLSLAGVSLQQHSYRQSIVLADAALKSARRFSFAEIVRKSYSVLYSSYAGLKRYDMALRYRNLEIALKDSLYGIDKDKKVSQLQSAYELEKKQYEIDLLNERNLLQQKEVQTERERHFVFAGAALFFSLWAIFLFRGNREMDRLNRQLRSQKP